MMGTVICGAKRTAMGGLMGMFAPLSAPKLGGAAIAAALADAGASPALVQSCVMGCVLPAGQGQAPARQAGYAGGLGDGVPALTVNKMCGSGMAAVMQVDDAVRLGRIEIAVAGGMESMTNAPYLLPKMRSGGRLGHSAAMDSMFLDGLEDAYDTGRLMGTFAEDCAAHFGFSRENQDAYALESLNRALAAAKAGYTDREITPVTVPGRKGQVSAGIDQQPEQARPDKIPTLKPAFREGGTVTAANASSISDGAAALVLASEGAATMQNLPVRARIVGSAGHAQAPGWFTTAPVPAARALLDQIGWQISDVDLWEVNEAFAVVPMAFMKELSLPRDVVNVHGGACALGHPIGASGARIIVTLLNALERYDMKRGVAAICIGGGEATAIAIERP
ncbi:acetyl-CoA C-acyltransferase [Rhodobacteraceae bacterium SC52]|nr:acetyl-CoA C-acyltransferase [Rhodobacteraceae bacterium SC52]